MNNNTLIESYINNLRQAESVEEVHRICLDVTREFGFDAFHYGACIPVSMTQPQFVHVGSYQNEWWELYKSGNFMVDDPTVEYCLAHNTPLDWSHVSSNTSSRKRKNDVMGLASDFGLVSGISFPIHTSTREFAMYSFVSSSKDNVSDKLVRDATLFGQLFAYYVHEALDRILQIKEKTRNTSPLTQREKECLLWAADGKTSWETSRILNVSERTVIFHVQNAANKLAVTSKQHAVAKAVSNGLINPKLG